jgi:hypothetical protein
VDLLGSLLSPEKTAKAAAAAPNTVDQGLPSARIAQTVQKFQNQRRTRCKKAIARVFPSSPWINY